MLLTNKNKSTIVVKTLNVFTCLRYMQNDVNTTIPIRTSNAIIDCLDNSSFQIESENICMYIAQGLDDGVPLSRLIAESPQNLGFAIHPDSFFSVTEMLIRRMGKVFYPQLYNCDDIQFYRYTSGTPVLKPDFREKYSSINVKEISVETVTTPPTTRLNPIPETNESKLPDQPQSIPEPEGEPTNNEYISLKDKEKIVLSNDEQIISNGNNENSNLGTIILYTICVFTVIVLWAWWDRNYNRKNDINNQNIVEEKQNNNDTVLHSVDEHMFYTQLSFKILLFFIPSFILVFYSLRNYYFYKYFYKFK